MSNRRAIDARAVLVAAALQCVCDLELPLRGQDAQIERVDAIRVRALFVEAAKERRDAALRRAYGAIDRLDEAGEPVTFAGVAAAASVSRAWLYRQPHIRAEIDRLRVARARSSRPVPPVAQRSSEESQQGRIEALLEDNKCLRDECRQLRDQIARLLGEQRMARIRPRP